MGGVFPGPSVSSTNRHAVAFYDDASEVAETVSAFVAEGVARDERVIVVGTAGLRGDVEARLRALGLDPAREQAEGRYVTLDATDTLETFLVDGVPDRRRFRAGVGGVVRAAAGDGSVVRVCGEMVALLWDRGDAVGALTLESLWNELLEDLTFSLLCAYPSTVLGEASLADLRRVCESHSTLSPPARHVPGTSAQDAGELDTVQRSEVFVPVPCAVPAARRFVTRVLEEWGEQALEPVAELVISELATNAVVHAGSPFRAFLHRSGGVLLVAVKDATGGRAERRQATLDGLGGRGVAIIEALAQRWGSETLPEGKLVWAELPSP